VTSHLGDYLIKEEKCMTANDPVFVIFYGLAPAAPQEKKKPVGGGKS
jgi:hypothetical protein